MSSNSSCSTPSVTASALINSVSQLVQSGVINPSPTLNSTPNNSIHLPSQGSSTQVFFSNQEEKIYKKEKQILLEFETKTKGKHKHTHTYRNFFLFLKNKILNKKKKEREIQP